jgi:hypothetical protein
MAILEKDERKILLGIGIGLGAGLLIKSLAPAFQGMGRPVAKAAIRGGIGRFDAGRETLARWRETWEDLIAEVRAEMEEVAKAAVEVEEAAEEAEEGGEE